MRIAYVSLALASLALAACGDDGGNDRADAAITVTPDSAVDEPDADTTGEPDADTSEPDADTSEPDADTGGGDGARLILSEIVDGDLTGGQPKFIEITNTGDEAADLSGYSFGMFANGGSTLTGLNDSALVLSGTLEPGDSIVINCDNGAGGVTPGATFLEVYGFEPDILNQDFSFNGDDVLVLFEGAATGDGSNATIVDIYGVYEVDGSGTDWEHTDSFAVRRPGFPAPTATFDVAQWVVNPPRTLDGLTPEQHDDLTSPGVHSFTP